MSKIVVIPNNKNDIDQISSNNFILIGLKGYSVNTLNLEFNEIKDLCKTKKVFLSINKNIENNELDSLREVILKISKLNIEGLFYYDVSIVNIVNKLNLNINLIWSAEHFTTNYFTINYWNKHGVRYAFLSNEITKDEIIEIANNTDSKLIVQLFGYIPMYVSKRHAVKNYLKYFNLDLNSKNYSLFKENREYSIIDNIDGTMIYSDFILNGLKEYLDLKDKIEYVLINGYQINSEKLFKVIDMFNTVNNDNITEYEKELSILFNNLKKGFLYEKSIYKVKKNDK